MDVPKELRYTKSHEWAKPQADEIVVGITAHAQEELRDVVYVELPAVGKVVQQAARRPWWGGCTCCPSKEPSGEKSAKTCPPGCTKPCCASK